MPTHSVTARQRQVLAFVKSFLTREGYPPSLREIGAHLGLTGTRAVEKQLAAVERKGRLRRGEGARALRLPRKKPSAVAVRDALSSAVSVPILGSVPAGRPLLAEENRLGSLAL